MDTDDLVENQAVRNKAEKSSMSYATLMKVYRRGVAAWNSGHRPGTTPEQWGLARVNSYVTKGKGTYYGADKDLHEEELDEKTVAKDKESGEPKKYVAGLSKSTAKARSAHWDKMDKLDDRDPRAYEPAPGDATAKTKPSKHTMKFKQMYGEEVEPCCDDCAEPIQEEAEYEGRKVTLNKPFGGDSKHKRYVYVKNEKGNIIKLGFGDPNMEIKRDDPERRKAYRARHNCDNPGPKWKANYWSCKYWSATPVSKLDEKVSVSIPLYVQEAAYEGNIGMMELAKFYMKANEAEKKKLQDLIKKQMFKDAWKLVQTKTGVKLVGKEFNEAVSPAQQAAIAIAKKKKQDVEEEVAANSVAGGGVDMNPTGVPKWDKRSKFHIDHMFRRADGTKYKKEKKN